MKKLLCLAAVLAVFSCGAAWAKATPDLDNLPVFKSITEMKSGLATNFLLDLKIFDLGNPDYGSTSDWYFYPVYRAMIAYVFDSKTKIGIFADVEKPGYANITYPTLKVNELYGKFREGSFYIQLGRQVFGDKDDLLLGFQNDAVRLGLLFPGVDLAFFVAKTALLSPWGSTLDGMVGAAPVFYFGPSMGLKAYLLLGTEPVTVTPIDPNTGLPGTPRDTINSNIWTGAKYFMNLPVGSQSYFDLGAQLGLQFAMARTAADTAINATSLGLKVDGEFGMQSSSTLGFAVGGHVIYTGGISYDNLGAVSNYGFVSPNDLVGSGPGFFSKIQDGAGPYTYVDSHIFGPKYQQYSGVFAFGLTGELEINQTWIPEIGVWIYSDTDENGQLSGVEPDLGVTFKPSEVVAFYAQGAFFMPGWSALVPGGPAPNMVSKLLLGSSITF